MFNMKSISLALALICCGLFSYGQKYTNITIKAGDEIDIHGNYRFDEFKPGVVKFNDGRTMEYKFNFNLFTNKMDFIDAKKDTLAIAKPQTLAYIQVGSGRFYYTGTGYKEIFADKDSFKLVVTRKTDIEPVKIGALGLPNKTASILDYPGITTVSSKFVINEDVVLKREDIYTLITPEGEIEATKNNFIKNFKRAKPGIEQFIKSEKINFYNAADLQKLFNYCL